ncbi:unnamed protein product [Ambrosiozyma monospora]|uniref:Unnamed protein product n=1 Tax=Ambrosiozyma monospora TaxID=43982 RepID=A0ACB5TWT6_AMBMO|nr:unnamed protein product [Ambrosiozyma monospora]
MASFCSFFQLIMFCFVSPGSKFVLVVAGFFFGGIGNAMGVSQQNLFLSRFENSSFYLGCYHGCYGIGATVSPLIATAMVNSGVKWSYFYFILLGLGTFNLINLWLAFGGCEVDMKEWGEVTGDRLEQETQSVEVKNLNLDYRNEANDVSINAGAVEDIEPVSPKRTEIQSVLRNFHTWLFAIFLLLYQGAEVVVGGWVVTFLEDYRDGSKKSTGYIASGFWAGLTVGRLVITPMAHKFLGSKRSITLTIVISIICAVLTWTIPCIPVEAVFVALVGMFSGPMFPLMVTVISDVIPLKIQFLSMTIISAFGSSGGAIFPFIVGI